MAAVQYDIEFCQGETLSLPILWNDSSGNPVNLTGYSAILEARDLSRNNLLVVDASTANGRIALGGAAGTITITIDSTVTPTLAPGKYAYELWADDGSTPAVKTRLLYGNFIVDKRLTAVP